MTTIAILFSYAVLLGLAAVVYSAICTEPGEIFSGLYKFLQRKLMAKTNFLNQSSPERQEFHRDNPHIAVEITKEYKIFGKAILVRLKKLRDFEWIFKPLIGCEKCVSGQMGLWLFVPVCWHECIHYFVVWHVLFICISIYFSILTKTLYLWMKNYQANH